MNRKQFVDLNNEFDSFMAKRCVYSSKILTLIGYNYTPPSWAGYLLYAIRKNTKRIVVLGIVQENAARLSDAGDYSYSLEFTAFLAKTAGTPTLSITDKTNWDMISDYMETVIPHSDRLDIAIPGNATAYLDAQRTLYSLGLRDF